MKDMDAYCCWFIDTWDFSPLALALTCRILCQGCWDVKELHVPFPGGRSHTWSPGGFLSWCKLFQAIAFHVEGLCQAFKPQQESKRFLLIPGKRLTSESFGFCLEGKLREDLSLSSLSCRVNGNCEHWEAVASVRKQNMLLGWCWCSLLPSSWRHQAGPGSRAESSLSSGGPG